MIESDEVHGFLQGYGGRPCEFAVVSALRNGRDGGLLPTGEVRLTVRALEGVILLKSLSGRTLVHGYCAAQWTNLVFSILKARSIR